MSIFQYFEQEKGFKEVLDLFPSGANQAECEQIILTQFLPFAEGIALPEKRVIEALNIKFTRELVSCVCNCKKRAVMIPLIKAVLELNKGRLLQTADWQGLSEWDSMSVEEQLAKIETAQKKKADGDKQVTATWQTVRLAALRSAQTWKPKG